MTDLARIPVSEAARLLRTGAATPGDLLAAVRNRIAALDDTLGCYRWLAPDIAAPTGTPPAAAAPLWGVPGAVKANICRRGWPVDCASRILAGWRAPYDAHAVARLDAAGALLLGTSAMDEFGMGSSTEHAYDLVTRNPWATDRTAGGSSGGGAAAVAAGLAGFALGSDTGGSVRQPAHCCGIVGLKPGYGRVSRSGLVAHASSLDVIGILARTVADAAVVFDAVAGHDPADSTSCPEPVAHADADVRGKRVGFPRGGWDCLTSADQQRDLDAALRALSDAGMGPVEVDLPPPDLALAAYTVIAAAETSANLARYDGTHFGRRDDGPDHGAVACAVRGAGFGLEVKLRILAGAYVLSDRRGGDLLDRAFAVRDLVRRTFDAALDRCDVLLLPTCDGPAFRLGEFVDDPVAMREVDRWTVPASLAGLPALTVPTGWCAEGLPLSCQLVGRVLDEGRLLEVGSIVEAGCGFRLPAEVTT